jgi:TetR/AcrR family transcriptional repressor of nem operon
MRELRRFQIMLKAFILDGDRLLMARRSNSGRRSVDRFKTTGHIETVPRPSLREQLLSAGVATLHQRGFNASSVQDIADAAGAPKGSFYNHFESKEALAAEAVRRYVEKSRERRKILYQAGVPPVRRLRRYFEGLIQAAVDGGFSTGCFLGNLGAELSSQSPLVRERVAEAFAAWCEAIAEVIAEAQKSGAIPRTFPPKALAEFVIHAWEGAILRARVEQDRAPLDLFLKLTFARILA